MKSIEDILKEVSEDLVRRLQEVAKGSEELFSQTAKDVKDRLEKVAEESLTRSTNTAKEVTERLDIVAKETNVLLTRIATEAKKNNEELNRVAQKTNELLAETAKKNNEELNRVAQKTNELLAETVAKTTVEEVKVVPEPPIEVVGEKPAQPPPHSEVKPIEYLGGVMDEETRPLLKSYINQLGEGEAALVVFRRLESDPASQLLESDIKQISGHDWNFVSGGDKNDPMQGLVNDLSKTTSELRVANSIFSQGGAKIKAFDQHQVCFGLISKNPDEPITSIKGIVHQQLNMGLNGDLLLHEGDIIVQSLVEHNVFKQDGKDRPLHVTTYGAGGSAHEEYTPGVMAVSDGVIDIRTHVDPECIMNHLKNECLKVEEGEVKSAEGKAFYEKLREMEDTIKVDREYSGIAMIHDLAELSRRAAAYTGMSTQDIMAKMKPDDKRYYGEITFGEPSSGVTMIHRIDLDENKKPFQGNDGQKKLVSSLQNFMVEMGKIDPKAQKEHLDKLKDDRHFAEYEATGIAKNINQILKNNLSREDSFILSTIDQNIKTLANYIEERSTFLIDHLGYDNEMYEELAQANKMDEARIQELISVQNAIYDNVSKNLKGVDKEDYEAQKSALDDIDRNIGARNEEINKELEHQTDLNNADKKLKTAIALAQDTHKQRYPEGTPFGITACGNIFFTEHDKKSVGKYGANLVEMENQLFVEIIHHALVNEIYVDKEFITKIAADPLKIHGHVSDELNKWAKTYSLTVDDYVAAYEWARNGQSFEKFPECGRWTVAQELCKDKEHPEYAKLFYNFGKGGEVKIVNPFWKEIGTDLLKEIKDGKAFQGQAFQGMNFKEDPLKAKKQELMDFAQRIIENPNPPTEEVRELFSQYLELMEGMKLEKGAADEPQRYRVYARDIPVLKAGYVKDDLSDWDQPLYKSSNTALLDNEAANFLSKERGKKIGGGVALMKHPNLETTSYKGPNVVLGEMMKIERSDKYTDVSEKHKDIYEVGKKYLDQKPETFFTEKDNIQNFERIHNLVQTYSPEMALRRSQERSEKVEQVEHEEPKGELKTSQEIKHELQSLKRSKEEVGSEEAARVSNINIIK